MRIFSVLLVLAFGSNLQAQALTPEEGLRGFQTLSNVAYNLPRLLQLCLDQPDFCELTPIEHQLIRKITDNYHLEAPNGGIVDPKDNPGYFDLDENSSHRIAITGDQVGDMIYFNLNYLKQVDFFTSIALLVHEYGHHHGMKDTADRPLDVLGAKIASAIRKKTEIINLAAFNQPHIRFYVVNLYESLDKVPFSGTDLDRRKGTIIFAEDDISFQNYSSTIEDRLPCPFSVPVRGGHYIQNVRPDDPFDWSERNKAQGFALLGNVKMVCHKPDDLPKNYKIYETSMRMGFFLEPVSGNRVEGWWKKEKGQIGSHSAMNVFAQEGVSVFDLYFRANSHKALVLKKARFGKQTYQAGELVTYTGEIESLQSFNPDCTGYLSSLQFKSYENLIRYKFPVDQCRVNPIAPGRYAIEMKWQTPTPTPKRHFFVDSVKVTDAQTALVLKAIPEARIQFELKSPAIEKPMKVLMASLVAKRVADAKATLAERNLDLNKAHSFPFNIEDYAGLHLAIEHPKELVPESQVIFQSNFQHPTYGRIESSYFFASLTQAEGIIYQIPFNFSNQRLPTTEFDGVNWIYLLKGAAYSAEGKYLNNRAEQHTFKSVWLMNKNLEEIFLEMDMKIQYPNPQPDTH